MSDEVDQVDKLAESFARDLTESVREMIVRLLGPGRSPESVRALARNMLSIFDLTQERMADMFPPRRPVACEKGCTYCCHLLVFTDAPTVFLIADDLQGTLAPPAMEELKARLAAFEEADYGLSMVPRPACPLLAESLCQVYDTRPLVCRAQNSLDVYQCLQKYDGARKMVVAHDIPLNVWNAVSEGLSAGLAEAGLGADGNLELSKALRIALETPDAPRRWLAGEALFAPARWSGAGGEHRMSGYH